MRGNRYLQNDRRFSNQISRSITNKLIIINKQNFVYNLIKIFAFGS